MRTAAEQQYIDKTEMWLDRQRLENKSNVNAIMFYNSQIALFELSKEATRKQLEYDVELLNKTEAEYKQWLTDNPE